MNTLREPTATDEAGILHAALQGIRDHGLKAELARAQPERGQVRADAFVRVRYGTEATLYAAEVKRWLTPTNLGAIVARLRAHGHPGLLITDYVTPPVAQTLRALGVPFMDAAGNAYLRGKKFLVWVTGRHPQERLRAPRAQRAYQPTGLKLVFALLCNPEWIKLNYRELAMRAGVAHGTVGWVMRDLVQDRFLLETGGQRTRTRRLRNRRVLLDRWVEAYLRTLRPQTLLGRYQAEKPDWWRTLDPVKYGALLGGEPAGAVLTEYLKPGVVTLYLNGAPGNLIVEHRLRAAKDGNVEFRQRFWAFKYDWNYQTLTPPLLIYADLLGTGDARCIETARRIFDGHLARLVAED